MGERPGRCYREVRDRAYTRREFMPGVPGLKIAQFDMGDPSGSFDYKLSLIAKEKCQIRHNAIEAARVAANKYLLDKLKTGYHLKIKIYPHHILRENKMATGAGADRVQVGMRLSFGRPIGTAARVKSGDELITLRVSKEHLIFAKEALRRAVAKFPTPCSIIVEELKR